MRGRGVGRRGPGLVGTMATTAVVVGTAHAVSGAMSGGKQDAAAAQQQQAAAAQQADMAQQQQMADMQAQLDQIDAEKQAAAQQAAIDAGVAAKLAEQAAAPAPAAAPAAPAAAGGDDAMAKLQQLADMKAQGLLSDEEFTAAKAKLLA